MSLRWNLTFTRLSGQVRSANLYVGKPGKPGLMAIRICPPPACRSDVQGVSVASSAVLRAILHDGTYVSLQTARNPKGEIRGQVRVMVPAGG